MDIRTPGVWCLLVLLVVRDAVSQVNPITLESMTWRYVDPDTTLTVCATDPLGTGIDKAHLTVRSTDGTPQIGFDGVLDGNDPHECADFTVTTDLPAPKVATTTYELTTYTGTDSVGEGKVTFAFPLTPGEKINCESSHFTRFSVVGGSDLSGSGCISNSDSTACYLTGDSDPVCIPGLDQTVEAFEVCVPSGGDTITATTDITAVSLTYDVTRSSISFTITPAATSGSLELLNQTSTGPPIVTTCDGNGCTYDVGPTTDHYDLCGVYIDSSSGTSVGTHSFQDLQLTVDAVSTTTVDFRFANKNEEDDYVYNVYGDDIVSNPTTDLSFTLDCHNISPDSFCNGFFDDDDPLPTYISVSSIAKNNIVVTPVTTTTGSAPVLPPKVNQNAVDLTDQKTEGIVPSSA